MSRRTITTAALAALLAWPALLSTGGCAMSDAEQNDAEQADGGESAEVTKPDSASDAGESAPPADDESVVAPEPEPVAAEELPEWRKMWNFGDPAGTAAKFEEAIAAGQAAGDTEYVLIVTTQLGRTCGLRREFEKAHEILDGVEAELDGASAEVRMRYLLERGRTTNSSGSPEESVPFFEQAWEIGLENGEDLLAVDAAHMLAIVLPGEAQLPWSEKAMALAEASTDERCKGWLGPLYNNTGWTYHNLGNFDRALELWEKSLAFRQQQGAVEETFIARWAVARCWRSMGRYQDALAEQKAILDDRLAAGRGSKGYCEEEIGENLHAMGRADEARAWFAKAYDLLKDDKWMQADDAERLARMKELGGR